MMSDQTREHAGFRLHGRVQGVGFRWWTRRTADQLGIAGSVRNMEDGTVEVRAAGSSDTVREFESRLRHGPRSASVDRLERFDIDPVVRPDFRIEP